jgi:LysM repeat protein
MKMPVNSLATPKPLMAPGGVTPSMVVPRNSSRPMTNPLRRGTIAAGTSGLAPRPRRFATDPMVPRTRNFPSGVASRGRISPFEPRPLLAGRAPSVSVAVPLVASDASHLERVTVKHGDTYWKIAREYLGRGSRWQELLAINPGASDPRTLAAGSEIFVPRRVAVPNALASVSQTSRAVTVRPGDTLWAIARAHLGHGMAWTCLAHSNPKIQDPDLILPGEQISVPTSCGATP